MRCACPILGLLLPAPSSAQDYETRVVGEGDQVGVPSAWVSTVRPEDDPRAGSTVAEALDALPGVRVRSIGGLGSFGTVSIRGSTGSQVRLVLDGIPLATSASGVASVGDVSLESVEVIRVHRGAAPPDLGGGAIGGVVELRTAEPGRRPRFETQVTAGSFDTLRASALEVGRAGRQRWSAFAGTAYTKGDFAFFDDRGTPQNVADDRTTVRRNADETSVEAGLSLASAVGDAWSLESGASLLARDQGLPGLGDFQADRARLANERVLVQSTATRSGAWGSAGLRLTGRVHRDRFEDPEGEVGIGNRTTEDLTVGGAGTALATLPVGAGTVRFAAGPEWERFDRRDLVGPSRFASSPTRTSFALVVEHDQPIARSRIVVSPLLRVRRTVDSFEAEPTVTDPRVVATDAPARTLFGARLGARAALTEAVALRGALGTDQREPTFEELFGDGGAIAGNPELSPETGWTAELGASLAVGRAGPVRALRIDTGFFHSEAEDLIQLVQSSLRTATPTNLGQTRIRGIEAGLDARGPAGLGLVVGYTLLDSRNRSPVDGARGKRIPGRPLHDAHVVLEERIGPARVSADLDVVSGNTLDPANRVETPARTLVGLSAGLAPRWAGGLSCQVSVRNVFDHRVESVPVRPPPPGGRAETPAAIADYLGYPLPGRSVFVTLRFRDPT